MKQLEEGTPWYGKPRNPAWIYCDEPSLTKQSEQQSTDVNIIVATFTKTGQLPAIPDGLYLDVTSMGDYRTALDQVRAANEFFMNLPASTRALFDNDAAAFLDACADPTREEELKKLGFQRELTTPPAAPATPADSKPTAPTG